MRTDRAGTTTPTRVWLWSLAFAMLNVALLLTSVRTDFVPVRLRVVTADIASQAGAISITLPDSARLARLDGMPVVIVARVRNDGTTPTTVSFFLDGTEFGRLTVAPGTASRLDAPLPETVRPRPGSNIDLRSPGDRWSLQYLEVANLHGASNQFLKFVIVPAGPLAGGRLPLVLVLGVGIAVFGFALLGLKSNRPATSGARWARILYRATAVVMAVFAMAVLFSGILTPFKVLVAPEPSASARPCFWPRPFGGRSCGCAIS